MSWTWTAIKNLVCNNCSPLNQKTMSARRALGAALAVSSAWGGRPASRRQQCNKGRVWRRASAYSFHGISDRYTSAPHMPTSVTWHAATRSHRTRTPLDRHLAGMNGAVPITRNKHKTWMSLAGHYIGVCNESPAMCAGAEQPARTLVTLSLYLLINEWSQNKM